jgi:predicted RNase H-like nuclease (RuvC/YqgF family)
MSSAPAKKINTGRVLTILLIVIMGAGLGFFAYKYFQEKSKNEEQELNIENLTVEIEDLETDIEDYKTDLENKDLDIEEKERLLAEKEQLLQDKQRKIDQLVKQNKISASEAAGLKEKVTQMEYYIQKYQKEIDDLKAQVETLTVEKRNLEGKVDTITGQYRDTKTKLGEVEGKLKAAEILSARPFKFYRKKSSGKEIEEAEFRRGQMDNFKVCFDIAQNLAAERGKRTVYLQIIDPAGAVIKDDGGQSGSLRTYAGDDIAYSMATSFNFDGTAQNVCVDFPTPGTYEYEKGAHTVKVWCDGYDIGRSSFTVR